ncbi:MAG: gliding motility-associated C-terminal domain-containing protein [Saprospiraceae bacterium]
MNNPRTMLRFLHLSLLVSVFAVGSAFAQLSLSFDVDQPSCNGYTDGKIKVNPSGGDSPYDYQWSDGSTDRRRYSVEGGSYTVTVTDDAGTSVTETIQVVAPDELTLAINIDGDVCNATTASYDLVATGGTAPYTFKWDGQTVSNRVSNQDEGYHHVVVTDANGCNTNSGIRIYAPLTVFVKTTDVACFGFCDGTVEAKVEDGNGPYTFLWSNGATDQLVYNLDPGTYSVTVTDQDGCTAVASGTLSEPAPITFDVSLQDSCVGATTATVSNIQGGTGNTTVRWTTGTIGSSAYLTEGQHYVIVEDENGCETTERVIVSDGIQRVTYMNVDATCDSLGRSLLCITGGKGPFTYLWSNGQTGIEATGLVPGVYTFSIIDGGGCTYSGATRINGPDPADCNNCDAEAGTLTGGMLTAEDCDPITITATTGTAPVVPAGYQVLYVLTTAPNATISQVGPTPSFVIPMGGNGTYTIHTLVYDPTTLDLSGVVLGATMAADIYLQLIDGGGNICASLDLTGTTFVIPECTDPTGCMDGAAAGSLAGTDVCFDGTSSTLTPSQVTPPNVPMGYAQIFLLISVPGDTILATSTSPNFMVGAEGTYQIRSFVYFTDSLNVNTIIFPGQTTITQLQALLTPCESLGTGAAQFNVTLFDPAFDAALLTEPCPGEPVMLNANGDSSYSYMWSPSDSVNDATAVSPMATLTTSTMFNVLITQVVNGVSCTVSRTYEVNVSELPTLNAPADIVTCDGGSVDLEVANVNGANIVWSDVPDFSQILSNDSTLTVTSGSSTTYYVMATNSNGCEVTDEVTVGDFPVEVALADDYTICDGETTSLETQLTAGNATSYGLYDSQGNLLETTTTGMFDLTPAASEQYEVVAINPQGCADTATIAIDVSLVDASLLTAGLESDTTIYPGNEVNIFAGSSSTGTFIFDEDGTYVNVNNSQAAVMPDSTTTYLVTVTDEFGCEATAELVIEVLDFECDVPFIFVPNAFSPDGDMINDIFFIDGVNVDECYYSIFNRWGEQVYESYEIGNENGNGWDGTFNGQPVDPDVYGLFVRIRCNDGDEFYRQGNVTVIR